MFKKISNTKIGFEYEIDQSILPKSNMRDKEFAILTLREKLLDAKTDELKQIFELKISNYITKIEKNLNEMTEEQAINDMYKYPFAVYAGDSNHITLDINKNVFDEVKKLFMLP